MTAGRGNRHAWIMICAIGQEYYQNAAVNALKAALGTWLPRLVTISVSWSTLDIKHHRTTYSLVLNATYKEMPDL